ncbi:hypothetical protein [Segeticoccus rhizosphaerae]|uniref:hypothetical protein n=1 Tax=Segeticoccus rhizosphaerae TaxID=1104777 RepID=UPI0010C13047|nr:hypothetical protein [Ornithinicoccus soli]
MNFGANGLLLTLIIALQQRAVAPSVIGLLETGLAAGMLVGAAVLPTVSRPIRRIPLLSKVDPVEDLGAAVGEASEPGQSTPS